MYQNDTIVVKWERCLENHHLLHLRPRLTIPLLSRRTALFIGNAMENGKRLHTFKGTVYIKTPHSYKNFNKVQ